MSPYSLSEQLKNISVELIKSAKESLSTARNIYLNLIGLVIMVSVGAIPLIGILISYKNIKEVKSWILGAIIALVTSIGFGIAALINHALFFRKESNDFFKQLQEAHQMNDEGAFQLWLEKQKSIIFKHTSFVKDLNYRISIIQLFCFSSAIILLVISLFKIL